MSAEKEWKKPNSEKSIEFVRPSQLAKDEFEGVILEGTFVESLPNHFDETKSDFKFEKEDGSVVVINGAGNLGYRMKAVSPGDYCQISYEGKKEIASGKMKGKSAHCFDVLIA